MAKFVVRDLAAVASSVPVLIKHKLSRRGKWLRFHRSGFPDTYTVLKPALTWELRKGDVSSARDLDLTSPAHML